MISYVKQRLSSSSDRDFPAQPTLAADCACAGLAFLLEPDRPAPDLKPLRDSVSAMWRGRLAEDRPDADLLVVLFAAPADPGLCPAGLPLRSEGPALRSFAAGAKAAAGPPSRAAASDVRRLELFWRGRRHSFSIDALEPVSLAQLWDLPVIEVHRPIAFGSADTCNSEARGPALRDEKPAAARLAPVSRAPTPFTNVGSDAVGEIEKQLRALHARTSLSAIFKQALGLAARAAGTGRGGRHRRGIRDGAAPRGEPGLRENLAGWIRWRTPLGQALRRQFGQRLRLVEKLIAGGDVDAALKIALALGAEREVGKLRKVYPNGLPPMRAQLDFQVEGGIAAPILGGNAYVELQARYRSLADDLQRRGDYRRAAFVFSKLLGDHYRAILTLEAGGMFADAARLAIDSKQDPALIIRMLYQAGEREAALAFARRAVCFDHLAEESRNKDTDYHAYVIKAWTDILSATGQPLRALQVSDHLAEGPDPSGGLIEARREWVAAALTIGAENGFSAETAARALLTASWTASDLPTAEVAELPDMDMSRATPGFASLLHWLRTLFGGEAEAAREGMLDLLDAFARLAAPQAGEQSSFWAQPAQPFLEAFARALVRHASTGVNQQDLRALQSLLRQADVLVLAQDIGKLRTLHKVAREGADAWRVPAPASPRPAVICGCLLTNGNALIWRESNLLQLLDRHGTALWQRSLRDVTALVPIATGPNVVIVQRQWDGTSLLTRFASHERRFHPIGGTDLTAHHDITSETQWLVQIGAEIGALDLVKLCAPVPRIEFIWTCALTSNLRAVGFADGSAAPSWLTRDVGAVRPGVVELWTLRNATHLHVRLCIPAQQPPEEPPPASDWWWLPEGAHHSLGPAGPATGAMTTRPWSEEAEREAMLFAARRAAAGVAGVDSFQSCDFHRPWVATSSACRGPEQPAEHETRIVDPRGVLPPFMVQDETAAGLRCIARGAGARGCGGKPRSRAAGPVLLADMHGRLFLVNLTTRRVTQL
ncbi:MAG TPA: hypothetical protein VF727_15385 [Allosphingosinicella sp.]|jgi:hypothetical protein